MAGCTSMDRPLVLLDAASLYFRAYYGVPESVTAPDGTPVNAVRGFTDMVAFLVERRRPSRLVACLDLDWRPAFRVAAISSYKEHRVAQEAPDGVPDAEQVPDTLAPQVPLILDVLAAAGIATAGAEGFEADDVIGTLVATERRDPVEVVSGDRDLFQVVDDARQVRVLYIARGVGKHEIVDDAWVRAKYQVPASAYVDYATLRGDASDGLPGVAGIGEKTAAKLIATYGSLVSLREAIAAGDPAIKGAQRSRLEAGAAYLDVAPMVVRVAPDAPVPEVDMTLPTAVADPALMSRIASEYGVTNSFNRVLAALGIS
jgi:5'-3' exonuclease